MHGGNLREAKEKFNQESFIDLSANINPFGPPQKVWQRLNEALSDITHYPDPEYKQLTTGLSQHFGLPLKNILVGNGAGELLFTLTFALQPRKVLIPVPGFSEYEKAASAVQAEIEFLTLGANGWDSLPGVELPDKRQEFIAFWKNTLKGCDLVYLNSPHNPTGSILKIEQLQLILQIAEDEKCWVLFDESFCDFLSDDQRWSARELLVNPQCRPNMKLIVLYSMTKFFSLPGLRLGVLFAQPEIIEQMRKFRDPWSVNVLAEAAGVEALKDWAFPNDVRQRLKESRDYFYKEFELANFDSLILHPTTVNFVLIEIIDRTAVEVVEELGALGVLVRNCNNFRGLKGQYIRTAIKDIASMEQLIKGLKQIFQVEQEGE